MVYTIGDLSKKTGVSIKTIRYYEKIGLLTSPQRAANNYRLYADKAVSQICFIQRAKTMGFALSECHMLLALCEDKQRASSDVKKLAQEHLNALGDEIKRLQHMYDTLEPLITLCQGSHAPECPILQSLEQDQ